MLLSPFQIIVRFGFVLSQFSLTFTNFVGKSTNTDDNKLVSWNSQWNMFDGGLI
jgi:hypothetical protein